MCLHKLGGVLYILRLGLLFFLFLSVFKPNINLKRVYILLVWFVGYWLYLAHHWPWPTMVCFGTGLHGAMDMNR